MNKFQPHISVDYPPNNKIIFEEWFADEYYNGAARTDRDLLPFFPTSYWVNNNYGNDQQARKEAQDYIDSLPDEDKYFVICQYDDGCMVDWKGKDVLEFNMSKKIGVEIPLLCQPHPYIFNSHKKYIASFIGSRTHPIRNELEQFKNLPDWYISYEQHTIQDYLRIINESVFCLCPRGYGLSSFRTAEAMQYESLPVYISDEHILSYGKFDDYIIYVNQVDISRLPQIIDEVMSSPEKLLTTFIENCKSHYKEFYSYEGAMKKIIECLENEPPKG